MEEALQDLRVVSSALNIIPYHSSGGSDVWALNLSGYKRVVPF